MPTATSVLSPSVLATAAKLKAIPEFQREKRGLIAKHVELHMLTLCVVTKLHPLFYGTAGTAKSMTVDGLLMHIPELSKFKTQAYKASPPEQFFGPISFKGMAEDRFVRITTGRVADSEIVFVDEVDRAPRSVLPGFQGIMVEREFDAGYGVRKVPLQTFVGTSNHVTEDPELAAFMDRWAFKFIVRPVQSQEEFIQVMEGALRRHEFGEPAIPPELLVTRAELTEFQEAATHVHVDRSLLVTLAEIWSNVLGIGIEPSIRRYTDLVKGMRGEALLDGRDECSQDDLQIAAHSLWQRVEDAERVYKEVVAFASDWIKEKSKLLDDFAETLDRLGQVQSLVAAGTDTAARVEIKDIEGEAIVDPAGHNLSITDHAIKVVNAQRSLAELVEKHIADASGQDTAELQSVLTQIEAGRTWVSQRLIGGLPL